MSLKDGDSPRHHDHSASAEADDDHREIDLYLIVRLRGQTAKRNTSIARVIADIVKAVATDGHDRRVGDE